MEINSDNSVWITWEQQTRNRSMSRVLGIPLFELLSRKPRLIRYMVLGLRTIRVLSRGNIKFAFVQNPSIALAVLAVFLKRVLRYRVVVDAHNAGIRPSDNSSSAISKLAKLVIKYSDLTIVTNSELEQVVIDAGGRSIVFPDPIPDLPDSEKKFSVPNKPYVLLICSWSSDEPYKDIIVAMESVPELDLYITGNYKKALSQPEISVLPENVKLLGFVSEDEYFQYLRNSRFCVDLTTREDCLVCGAYEAAALDVPCIISDTSVNRSTFYKGFVYSKTTPKDIYSAIIYTNDNADHLKREVRKFSEEHKAKTLENIKALKAVLIGMWR